MHIFIPGLALWALLACCAPGRAQVASESSGTVAWEAETFSVVVPRAVNGTTYNWAAQSDLGGFSGSGFMQAQPNDDTVVATNWTAVSPELQYSVSFANPGTYYVWLRGYADTADAAAVYVGLNGASPASAQVALPRPGVWAWGNGASGAVVALTVPSAGVHTVNIWMRESGFALDRILLTRNPNYSAEYSADFWRKQSIYQIVTDRFFDGDPSNNTLSPNYSPATGNRAHGGDFKGVERKLDYIQSLGATAIWISPVLLNGNGDYHGYAATDFYKTDPRMGTLADLQRLVREAHRRGILVVNDVVVNHGSTWVDSAEAGWPAFRYPPSGYTLRYNSGGRAYAAPFDNASLTAAFGNTALTNIFHHNGATQNWGDAVQVELGELSSLDDFRTESAYVRQRMRDIWSYWIGAAGFDAFRIDTVKHVEMGFWDDWCPAMRAAAAAADKPNFFQFGEIYDGSDAKVGSYTGRKTSGVYKMESALDYPLYYQVGSVFATATGNTGQIENRYNNLTTANYDESALMSLVLNLDNHDQPRFLNAAGSTTARLELALLFLHTSRGIPSLYYGTEQDFNGGADPNNREDMFDGQFESGPSLGDNFNMTSPRFQLVAKLNNLRRLYPALSTGTHQNLWANWSGPGLLAYARRLGSEEVFVVLNTATTAQTLGARPTIHPAGTVLVNLLNPAETLTVTAGVDGIPSFTVPGTSAKMFVASSQVRALAPVVTAVSPTHDAAAISPATQVRLTFSRAMNTATVQQAFSTVPATTGSFAWAAGNTELTYTPSANLAGTTLYEVRVGNTATDAAGLAMHGAFEARFTTGAASAVGRPAINSFSVGDVTDATATLTASVTPNGAATTVSFEYGTTTSYGTLTPAQSIGSGSSPVAVSVVLTGLPANTTHHFRVVATNSQGVTAGPDGTFTTTALLPLATTAPASFVTATTANLNGTVNPRGLPTSVWFEYGLQPNVLDLSTPAQDAGAADGNQDRWAAVAGLEPDTTYFFRMAASTGGETVRGAVQSCHTLPVKPTFSAIGLGAVQPEAATFTAQVSANGSPASVWFEYGTNAGYGAMTEAVSVTAQDVPVSAGVSGFAAGRTYHFRGVASNANGVTFTGDQSFVTGFAPPAVSTGGADPLTTSNAVLNGTVNPNGRPSGYWVEYGTGGAFTSSTRQTAADTAESYANFTYTAPDNNGGTGFGPYVGYVTNSSNTRGRRVLVTTNSANGTANRMIDGAKSFGLTAGTSTTLGSQSGYRTLTAPRQHGTFSVSLRCDVNNEKGFSGLNLKSQTGTSFGAGELLSVGMTPAAGAVGGNTALVVTDADGQRTVDFGVEMRGAKVDVAIDFDTLTGDYALRLTRRADGLSAALNRTVAGRMKLSGPAVSVTAFGFLNANNSGATNQNLIFDNLQYTGFASAGQGTDQVSLALTISGLNPGAVYTYRVGAASAAGTTYGATRTLTTGPDLVVEKTHTGAFLRAGTGQFQIRVSNAGASPSSGTVTLTEQPPAGMTIVTATGDGWTWNAGSATATRSGTLAAGAAFPPLTINVALAADAADSLVNAVFVTGGADANPANNAAFDQVSLNPAPAPIEAWRERYFGSPADSGPGADTNVFTGDGLANLAKYALGLDPTVAAVRDDLPLVWRDGESLAIRFRRAREATDVTLRVQAAGNLTSGWGTEIWSSATNAYGGGTNDFETVTVVDPVPLDAAPSGQRYLRLKVTRP